MASRRFHRRTATKVRNGKVQHKNRHQLTATLKLTISRQSPRPGFRHVLAKKDVQEFIDLIPDWPKLSDSLEGVVLSGGDEGADGSYQSFHHERTGLIHLEAWPEDLWIYLLEDYFRNHIAIFERLGVSHDFDEKWVFCRFTSAQAKAFMLLHVFLHELGHHVDRTTTRSRREPKRGEDFAEQFAMKRFDAMFQAYCRRFGKP